MKKILNLVLAFILAFSVLPTSVNATEKTSVAKVGDKEYSSFEEAATAWTNGKTLTLTDNVELSEPLVLLSTEHHILNLGEYTLKAAEGQNAIVIKASGTGSAERSALTVNATTGGIDAGNKSCIYYNYSDGKISAEDRPIIKINGGVFKGATSSFGSAGIYTKGTAARKAATLEIAGGTFNCSINGQGKSKLRISGGTFNYSVGSQGDSTAYRLIWGGRFKTIGFMTADSNNTKFWFGSAMASSNVGVYIDNEGYLVVGGPVITEAGDKFKAFSKDYSAFSSYLKYSSAATYGLFYTSVDEALSDNNKASSEVTVFDKTTEFSNTTFKGTILLPNEEEKIVVSFPSNPEPKWKVEEADDGELRVFTQSVDGQTVTRVYDAITPKVSNKDHGSLSAAVPSEPFSYKLVATPKVGYWFVGWEDENGNIISREKEYSFKAYESSVTFAVLPDFYNPHLKAVFAAKTDLSADDFVFTAPDDLTYNGEEKQASVSLKDNIIGAGEITVKYYKNNEPVLSITEAGSYEVIISLSEGERYNAADEITASHWSFVIEKAKQSAPEVSGEKETVSNKNDGKIIGVSTDMEYRKEGNLTYTDITAETLENLPAGVYFVRYKEKDNYKASEETEVVIKEGEKLKVVLPDNSVGFEMSATEENCDWMASGVRVDFELENGAEKTENFKVLVNGEEVELIDGEYFVLDNITEDCVITVEGVVYTPKSPQTGVEAFDWLFVAMLLTLGALTLIIFNKKSIKA